MSLRAKLWIAFALIAGLAVSLALYGARALNHTGTLIVRLYDEPLIGLNYARAAHNTLIEARRVMDQERARGPDQSFGAVASLRHMQADIAADLRIVRERIGDIAVIDALDDTEYTIALWFHSGMTVLAPPSEGALALPMPATIDRQGGVADRRVDDLVEQVSAIGFAYRSRAHAVIDAASVVLATLSGAIVLIGALFLILFAHLLIRPIRAATRVAEAVAAGKHARVVVTGRRDEIGRLLTSLAIMQTSLRSRAAQAKVLLQEKTEAAETLQQINMRFDSALNNMSVGLLMCDRNLRVVVVNRQFCDLFGIDPEQVPAGCLYHDLLVMSVAAGNHAGQTIEEILSRRTRVFEARQRTAITRTISGGRTVNVVYDPMPDGGWIGTYEDITERRRSEEQIVFLARHDALTRLPNRVLFGERLDQALAHAERGQGFALLWLDLDRFKAVNDVLGHPAGDALLRTVADRLKNTVRETDSVARLGGDEFAVLQSRVSTEADATLLADRIVRLISQPYDLDGHQVVIGTSIGIVMIPPGASPHPVQLMKYADLALYRAKQFARGTWRVYDSAMDVSVCTRRDLENDLSMALPRGEFELHYQPLVSAVSRSVTGFETLLRWRHPTRGLLPPGEFISIAEETGMIVPIAAWVIRQACAEAATWPDHLRVAINLSPLQFRDPTLLSTVTGALEASGLRPRRLEFEITESVPLQSNKATLSILHALQALGARIALDDFGTGYSSLSYLRSFPFDTIKIDRSFVSELTSRDDCVAIVRAVTALGATLNMNTTAEGVETEAQFEFLAAAGCTEIQGYLFSRPVPAHAVPELIQRLSKPPELAVSQLVAIPQ